MEGDNEFVVKVVHQSPNSRWYSGAGIYRHVWLKTRDRNHIVTDGIYVSINQHPNGWQVEVDKELNLEQNQNAELVHTIRNEGQVVASTKTNVTASLGENAVALADSEQAEARMGAEPGAEIYASIRRGTDARAKAKTGSRTRAETQATTEASAGSANTAPNQPAEQYVTSDEDCHGRWADMYDIC